MKTTIEAILFASGKGEKIDKIAQALKTPANEIRQAATELKKEYSNHGIQILEQDDTIQMVTNPQCAPDLEKFWKKDLREALTPISLETLAIIAYQGPISRFDLETIRGVNCTFVLRNLLRRDLIKRKNKGKRTHYEISPAFLRHLGLTQIQELPKFQSFQKNRLPIQPHKEVKKPKSNL